MPKDFRDATDELFAGVSHDRLAEAMGVSVATVRQARLDPAAKAHRNAPEGWRDAVAGLAEMEGYRLLRLAKAMDKAAKAKK